jgi:hypothetical protein
VPRNDPNDWISSDLQAFTMKPMLDRRRGRTISNDLQASVRPPTGLSDAARLRLQAVCQRSKLARRRWLDPHHAFRNHSNGPDPCMLGVLQRGLRRACIFVVINKRSRLVRCSAMMRRRSLTSFIQL